MSNVVDASIRMFGIHKRHVSLLLRRFESYSVSILRAKYWLNCKLFGFALPVCVKPIPCVAFYGLAVIIQTFFAILSFCNHQNLNNNSKLML